MKTLTLLLTALFGIALLVTLVIGIIIDCVFWIRTTYNSLLNHTYSTVVYNSNYNFFSTAMNNRGLVTVFFQNKKPSNK